MHFDTRTAGKPFGHLAGISQALLYCTFPLQGLSAQILSVLKPGVRDYQAESVLHPSS
jgi:hypothetical protein